MKNIFKGIMLALLVAGGFTSCSDSEDTTPSYVDANGYAPADNDNSETAQLRRQFKEQTGSYLLFTDTLSKKQVSVDAFGKPVYDVEMMDITYNMMGLSDNEYRCTYKYITDTGRQRQAVQTFIDKLGSRLGKTAPFSVLLVDSISQWTQNDKKVYVLYKKNPHPVLMMGARCCVVSLSGDDAFTKDDYFDSMLETILYSNLKINSNQLEEYWAPVKNLIGKYKDDLGYDLGYDEDLAKSLGFLTDWNKYFFCTKKDNDLKDYVHAICTYSLEQFEEEYEQYPICISRFKILRNYVLSLGVKLDK